MERFLQSFQPVGKRQHNRHLIESDLLIKNRVHIGRGFLYRIQQRCLEILANHIIASDMMSAEMAPTSSPVIRSVK